MTQFHEKIIQNRVVSSCDIKNFKVIIVSLVALYQEQIFNVSYTIFKENLQACLMDTIYPLLPWRTFSNRELLRDS